jgi:hypothetical protein
MVDEHAAYRALKARNYNLAKQSFSELAAAGSAKAWTNLGWMYQHAAGVEKNVREAESCYEKAILLGDVAANFYLARLLVEQRDYDRAFTYFSTAANAGHLPSVYWLGRSYLAGRGVARDVAKAEHYLKDAMARGHLYARRDYHRYRVKGVLGGGRFSDRACWLWALVVGIKQILKDPRSELLQ